MMKTHDEDSIKNDTDLVPNDNIPSANINNDIDELINEELSDLEETSQRRNL